MASAALPFPFTIMPLLFVANHNCPLYLRMIDVIRVDRPVLLRSANPGMSVLYRVLPSFLLYSTRPLGLTPSQNHVPSAVYIEDTAPMFTWYLILPSCENWNIAGEDANC